VQKSITARPLHHTKVFRVHGAQLARDDGTLFLVASGVVLSYNDWGGIPIGIVRW
jgi:hypothetical protein